MRILVVAEFKLTTLQSGLAISMGAGISALTASQSGRLAGKLSEEARVFFDFLNLIPKT